MKARFVMASFCYPRDKTWLAVDLDDGPQLPSGRMVRVGGNCFLASSVESSSSLGTSTGLDHLGEYGDGKAIVRDFRGVFFWGKSRNVEGGNHAKTRWRSILNLHYLLNYAVVHVGTLKFQCPARIVAIIGVVQGHWSNVGLRDGGFLPEAIRWVPV